MVNKRGYLLILESLLALVLLLGFFIYISQKNVSQETKVPLVVEEGQRAILNELVHSESFKSCILNYGDDAGLKEGSCAANAYIADAESFNCASKFQELIDAYLPFGYEPACEICGGPLSCFQVGSVVIPPEASVFTATTFLAGDGSNSKVVRLYFYLNNGN